MKLTKRGFISIAFDQLRRNKSRSFLTMLGVVIGVASVVLLVSIGNGLKQFIEEQLEDLGANRLYVFPGNPLKDGTKFGTSMMLASTRFSFKDVSLVKRVPGVVNVAPISQLNAVVGFSEKEVFVEIHGTTAEMMGVVNINLESGRFFTKAEESRGSEVAVIGDKVREELFNSQDPIGRKIKVGNKKVI